jgi:hypothetical protein
MKRTTESPPHERGVHPRQVDRDIDLKGVAATVIGILVGTVVAAALMWVFFASLVESAEEEEGAVASAVRQIPAEPPPGPRLQASPEQELAAMRAEEDRWLSSYGWSEGGGGRVRIPVELAMEMVAAQGVPGRRGPAPPAPGAPAPEGGQGESAATAAGGVARPDATARTGAGDGGAAGSR